jgi:hypothetical protein
MRIFIAALTAIAYPRLCPIVAASFEQPAAAIPTLQRFSRSRADRVVG